MIVPTKQFIPPSGKFLHDGHGKKMPKRAIDGTKLVYLESSSDDDYTGFKPHVRCQIEALIKEKMLDISINNMVNNDGKEVSYLCSAIEGVDYR